MVASLFNRSYPIIRLRGDMDRLFDGIFQGFPRVCLEATPAGTVPAVNVWEDEENIFAEAELPGLMMDNVEVLVMDNELTIKGERKDTEDDGVSYHRRERGVGSFCHVLQLPVDIDADRVEAGLHNGVLEVKLPKAAAAKPRKVQVKALSR